MLLAPGTGCCRVSGRLAWVGTVRAGNRRRIASRPSDRPTTTPSRRIDSNECRRESTTPARDRGLRDFRPIPACHRRTRQTGSLARTTLAAWHHPLRARPCHIGKASSQTQAAYTAISTSCIRDPYRHGQREDATDRQGSETAGTDEAPNRFRRSRAARGDRHAAGDRQNRSRREPLSQHNLVVERSVTSRCSSVPRGPRKLFPVAAGRRADQRNPDGVERRRRICRPPTTG